MPTRGRCWSRRWRQRDFLAAGGSDAAVLPHARRLRGHDADRAVLSRPGTTAGRRHAVRATGGQPASRRGSTSPNCRCCWPPAGCWPTCRTAPGRRWSHSRRAIRRRRSASVTNKCHYSRTNGERDRLARTARRPAAGTPAGEEATEWVLFRGNAARNAESRGGFPLLTARWRVRAANHPSDEEMIRQQREHVSRTRGSRRSRPAAAGRGQRRDHADAPAAGGGRHGDGQTHLGVPVV